MNNYLTEIKGLNLALKTSSSTNIQSAFTCSNLTLETIEQDVKYVQS